MKFNYTAAIVAAATKIGDAVYSLPSPKRHHDIVRMLYADGVDQTDATQVFITSDGDFVNRKQAKTMVRRNQQPTINDHHPNQLFSEDLW